MKKRSDFSLTGSTLKFIAIISMTIDHAGVILLYNGLASSKHIQSNSSLMEVLGQCYHSMRFIGRLAFPIFCFLLVEGFLHTRNIKKYAGRLFLFALISEIPFDYALSGSFWDPGFQNVFFTLFLGVLALWGLQYFREKPVLAAFVFFLMPGAAYLLKTDYSYTGVFLIELLYLFRTEKKIQAAAGAAACLTFSPPAALGFLPILLYQGKRGRTMKYFFYLFYPVHLLLFGMAAQFLSRL